MKRLLLPLAAIAIAGLLLPALRPAYACSCAAQTPEQHVDNASVIAIGTVVRLIDATEQLPPVEGNTDGVIPDVDAVVKAERYLKGSGPAEFEVDDPPSGGTCGFLDQSSVGKRYLLFLTGESSPFETHLCSGSTLLSDEPFAQQFLQDVQTITGPGTLPQPGDGDFPWLPIIIGSSLATGAILAASALLLSRRLTRR